MYRTFAEVKKAITSGASVLEIVEYYISKIKENSDLNAFLEVFEDSARQKAVEVDQRIKDGTAGRLAGMVIGLKDNLCYTNHKVSASSKILQNFESLYTGTAVQRLIDEDAIMIGRLNCDEFAMGSSNENSAFGPVKNPLNKSLVPGGSSGGSAAAVAAGLCTATLGSDTGGSIRQPASFTGTFGLKPTYGRISRHGLIAYASSFDQIGPFTNSIEDSALLLEIMAGKDEYDSTVSSKKVENYASFEKPAKLKIAVLQENMVPTYYVLTTAEASSNLSRFDGVHYGYRSAEAVGVEATYVNSRSEGFGPEVQRRIMAGTFVLSNEFYDAYYTKGQKVRRVLKDKTDEIYKNFDMMILPTTPSTAFPLNAVKDPIQMYLQDIFTVHANLTGNPAISLPLGQHSNGMPFGIQVMADHFKEKELFNFSSYLTEIA